MRGCQGVVPPAASSDLEGALGQLHQVQRGLFGDLALGDLVIGWLLLTHAEIAQRRLDEIDPGHPDHDFY